MAATPQFDSTDQLPLDDRSRFHPSSLEPLCDEVHPGLLEHAKDHARSWIFARQSADHTFLRAELHQAISAVGNLHEECRIGDPATACSTPTAVLALVSARLLLSSSGSDIENSLRSKRPLPQVSAFAGQSVPRCYQAVKSYLAAVALDFKESTFRDYLNVVQQHAGYFAMREILLLSPMLQLDLLIRLGEFIEQSRNPGSDALQPTVAKILKSLDRVRKAAWKETFQFLSKTDAILQQDPVAAYPRMEFRSCSYYRDAVEQLARYSDKSEEEVAARAVCMAADALAKFPANTRQAQRYGHVGYYLVDKGRVVLENDIHYRPHGIDFVRAVLREAPELFYFLGIEFFLFAIMIFIISGIPVGVPFIATTLFFLLPASEAAIEVVNPFILFLFPPHVLPRLDFSEGIPDDCRTVVAVPTLLLSRDQVKDLVRALEIRYLGNVDRNLSFALLSDPPDSDKPFDDKDHLVDYCAELIQKLDDKYACGSRGRFFHLHRHRTFNETDQTWMGWERKRGKLLDFNEFLRGGDDRFPVKVGDTSLLRSVRYVITLDSDTQLPRDSARHLIAAMAHPLNQALIEPRSNTVRDGYGVLQPRVGISVNSVHRSRLAYIYSGQTGLDIYTNAVSDVYQDLFAEGIFTGKGIYEVDVFRQVLGDRFPSNAILSHDLIEGAYARTGLLTEVEIIDDYPSHFSAHSRRKHRWIRGDWQILRWLFPKVPDAHNNSVVNPLNFISRWKILDNLRRSVIEAATFILFLACWFVLPGFPGRWTVAALALLLIPSYIQGALALLRQWDSPRKFAGMVQVIDDFVTSQVNVLVFLAFLPHQALVTMDAIIRTVFRLTISRRKLLEWETAAQSEVEKKRKTPVDFYLQLTPILAISIALALAYFRPESLPVAAPILLLWFFSKSAARWLDRPRRFARNSIKDADQKYARKIAIKTWRFFREYCNEEHHWLIPDNIQGEQEIPAPRVSTTNLGMLFNVQYAAYHLGFLTMAQFAAAAERTMCTTKQLPRFHGHLVNWYDTKTLQPLEPLFISSVDNGNLACSLWSLKHGCLSALSESLFSPALFAAILDHIDLAIEFLKQQGIDLNDLSRLENASIDSRKLPNDVGLWITASTKLGHMLDGVISRQGEAECSSARWWQHEAQVKLQDLQAAVEAFAPWLLRHDSDISKNHPQLREFQFWGSLSPSNYRSRISEFFCPETLHANPSIARELDSCFARVDHLRSQLQSLAGDASAIVDEMDFGLFYDHSSKAISVGYDAVQNKLLGSFYDLLASEARSAVFVGIAKNEIPQEAWLLLGRTHTRYARRYVLISWTGTMFEYLMPALWMKYFPATLLERSLHAAVACQKAYVRRLKIPWGISEGACIAKNDSGHFGYQAFGIPPLALKAELPDKLVITPYASALALLTDPHDALGNLRHMEVLGWNGKYGFFESAEYLQSTREGTCHFEIVHTWMAHHQGMILVSICNLLSDGIFQRLFHEEVKVAATERILHELPLSPQAMQSVRDLSLRSISSSGNA